MQTFNDTDGFINKSDTFYIYGYDNQHIIIDAEFFIDIIKEEGSGFKLFPDIGSLDTNKETVYGVININNLSQGRHFIYFRMKDKSGKWG